MLSMLSVYAICLPCSCSDVSFSWDAGNSSRAGGVGQPVSMSFVLYYLCYLDMLL